MRSNMVWNEEAQQWQPMPTGGAKYAYEYDYVGMDERMKRQPSDMRLAYRARNYSVANEHAIDIIRIGAYGYTTTHDYRLAVRLKAHIRAK